MAPKAKKLIITSLRITIGVVALWWVLRNVKLDDRVTLPDGRTARILHRGDSHVRLEYDDDASREDLPLGRLARNDNGELAIDYGLKSILRHARKVHLLWAIIIFSPVPFLQSLRFLMMFRAQDIRLSFWECTKLCFAGNFLNFVALGTTGGDLVKAYYVCLHTDRRTEAVTTILLDRIVGLTGLVALVGLTILLFAHDARLDAFGSVSAFFLVAVVAGSTLLVSEQARRLVHRIVPRPLPNRAPDDSDDGPPSTSSLPSRAVASLASHARRVDQTTQRLIKHKPMVLGTVLVTMALQLIALTSWQAIVHALHMPWNVSKIGDYYAYLGSANVVAAIPITPQGIGTVEAYYQEFLAGNGVTVSQVLCLAMATRLLLLLWSLPGALLTMTGGLRPDEAIRTLDSADEAP
ncbi:MAG: flippase-like domain-containing protein [Phycisphaerales bacterium]|nr:MAG: flippase-like domain-containing protein [Phycisphaerales bacterium]